MSSWAHRDSGYRQRVEATEHEDMRRTGLLPNWFWPAYLSDFDAG
jgi:hypothetical protein